MNLEEKTNAAINYIKTELQNQRKEGVVVCLSGGIDSTILTHIAKDLIKNLHVYTIGVEGSRDLYYTNIFSIINIISNSKFHQPIQFQHKFFYFSAR